jgi:hypothetical protein
MPQLDITAYTTQLFWVLIILSLTYLVMDLYVLPHILRSLRLRARILDSIVKSAKEDNLIFQKQLEDNVSHFLDTFHKIADYKITLTALYDDKKGLLLDKINSLFLRQNLVSFISAASLMPRKKNIRSHKNIPQTRTLGIFAALFGLSDEFILMFCFALFAGIATFAARAYLKDTLDGKILDIKDRFLGPIELKLANSKAKRDLLAKISLLAKDKRKFSVSSISDLDKYARISDQKYFQLRVRAYFANIQYKSNSSHTASIQRILAVYFMQNHKDTLAIMNRKNKTLDVRPILNNAKLTKLIYSHLLKESDKPIAKL